MAPVNRIRRVVLIGSLVCLVPISTSWLSAMNASVNTPVGVGTVEWLRANGGAGLVSFFERIFYTVDAPSTGGPGLKSLGLRIQPQSSEHPPDLAPVIRPGLSGEGVWQPTETWSGGNDPLQITQFRSDPQYPRMVAGVAWIDPAKAQIALYAGNLLPSGHMADRGPEMVPLDQRPKLLATFNSGFTSAESLGGWADNGITYSPLVDGRATIVGYTNGAVNVEAWTGGRTAPANVTFARQNLELIASDGKPSPLLANSAAWGSTLGNATRVWRSGIGITGHGDLVYAAANDQTAQSLAEILIRAGAVRAMELDINTFWTTFNFYGATGAGKATKLLSGMARPATRYLSRDDRDFFAVYLR